MNRLMKDLAVDRAQNPDAALVDQWEAEEDEDQEGEDIDIVDRSKPFCEDLDVGCLAHCDDWFVKVTANGLGSILMSPELDGTVRKILIGQGLVDI
jgi:hypothetical protein